MKSARSICLCEHFTNFVNYSKLCKMFANGGTLFIHKHFRFLKFRKRKKEKRQERKRERKRQQGQQEKSEKSQEGVSEEPA